MSHLSASSAYSVSSALFSHSSITKNPSQKDFLWNTTVLPEDLFFLMTDFTNIPYLGLLELYLIRLQRHNISINKIHLINQRFHAFGFKQLFSGVTGDRFTFYGKKFHYTGVESIVLADFISFIANTYNIGIKITQCTIIRDIIGNPFKPVVCFNDFDGQPDAYCQIGTAFGCAYCRNILNWEYKTVIKLAQQIKSSADYSQNRLAILADALEEAGCKNQIILEHCRQQEGVKNIECPYGCKFEPYPRTNKLLPGDNRLPCEICGDWGKVCYEHKPLHVAGCWVIENILQNQIP